MPADMRAAFDAIELQVATGELDAMATFTRMRTAAQAWMPALAEPVAQPLTDEQIVNACCLHEKSPFVLVAIGIARATERAHGITGGKA